MRELEGGARGRGGHREAPGEEEESDPSGDEAGNNSLRNNLRQKAITP